jgi:hypothetical protein
MVDGGLLAITGAGRRLNIVVCFLMTPRRVAKHVCEQTVVIVGVGFACLHVQWEGGRINHMLKYANSFLAE